MAGLINHMVNPISDIKPKTLGPGSWSRKLDLSGPAAPDSDPFGPTKHEWKEMFSEPRSIEDGPDMPDRKVNVKGRAQAAQKLRVTDTSQKGFMKQVRSDIQKMSPKQFNKAYPVVDEFKKIPKISPTAFKNLASDSFRASNAAKITTATKFVRTSAAARLLGKANPWVGAALGAMELKRNVPQLVKGVPAYMKERQAQKTSEKNLKDIRARAASSIRQSSINAMERRAAAGPNAGTIKK